MRPTLIELENQLLAQLRSALPPATLVEAWPEKGLEQWLKSGGPKRLPAVLTHYAGSEFAAPDLNYGAPAQAQVVTWRLYVVARSLRDPGEAARGAYALLDACRAALTGLDLGGPGRLRPVGEEAIELSDTLAIFAADYEAELVWMQLEPETGPAFTQGTTIDTIGGHGV